MVLWALVVVQGLAFLEVLRQVGLLRKQIGPQQGAFIVRGAVQRGGQTPVLMGVSADNGRAAQWGDYIRGAFGVVVFLTPHCVTCREIASELTGLARQIPREVSLVAIIEGKREEVMEFIRLTHVDPRLVVIDEAAGTGDDIGIPWRPAALTLRDGAMGYAGIVNTTLQIEGLIQTEFYGQELRVAASGSDGHVHTGATAREGEVVT